MNKWLILLFAVCAVAFTAGCQQSAQPVAGGQIERLPDAPVVSEADPEAALEEIYKKIDIMEMETADSKVLEELFFIDPGMLKEHYVRYSAGRYGLADTFILKPAEGQTDQLRELLEQIKLARAREFADYDIYNARQIAQDATIFEQGGFLVMLMLPDNDAAREIIDRYIPKN